jgi:hypothetical protein
MKYIYILLLLSTNVTAQALYNSNGQYIGYSQTSPNGVTNIYSPQGQNIQSFQTDNGQTNFYSPSGAYQGAATAPITPATNSTINSPRQAPQVPTPKGW